MYFQNILTHINYKIIYQINIISRFFIILNIYRMIPVNRKGTR